MCAVAWRLGKVGEDCAKHQLLLGTGESWRDAREASTPAFIGSQADSRMYGKGVAQA